LAVIAEKEKEDYLAPFSKTQREEGLSLVEKGGGDEAGETRPIYWRKEGKVLPKKKREIGHRLDSHPEGGEALKVRGKKPGGGKARIRALSR